MRLVKRLRKFFLVCYWIAKDLLDECLVVFSWRSLVFFFCEGGRMGGIVEVYSGYC